MPYVTRSGAQFMYNGKRFRFVGFNYYAWVVENESQAQIQATLNAAQARGVTVMRTWCFDGGNPPTNSAGNFRYLSGNTLKWVDATFQQLDMVLDEARKRGIKLILALADNPTYNTKGTYLTWANAVYGTSLSATQSFFDDSGCRTIYKQFIAQLASRVNTINGRTYSADDTIFGWELGNELRYDLFTSEGGTQNTINSTDIAAVKDWVTTMSTYIKSVCPNALVGYGDMGHTWQWANGDTVSNGSGYGVDYNIFSTIATIDYLDFHIYPTQGDSVHLQEYGQRLGYPNAVSGEGFRAQLRDYVTTGKANSKPVVCGELGFVRESVADTTYYPLYPRYQAFKNIFKDFFAADGDGMILWSATATGGGSYSVGLGDTGGTEASLNSNDTVTMGMINTLNYNLVGKRKAII